MIWPRLEVFQLCTPQYSIFSRSLSPNLTLSVSRELFKHVGFDNQLTYDKWVIVARSHLKWNDYCIQFFWDILCLSIWYMESESGASNNNNIGVDGNAIPSTYKSSVDIYHLIILLVIHTSDTQARTMTMNQHHTYDAHVPWQHNHNSMDVINPGDNNNMQRNGGKTNPDNGNVGGPSSPNKNIFRLNTNLPYDNDPPRSPLSKSSGTNSSSPTKSPGNPRSPTRSHLGMLSPKLSKTPQQHLDSLRHKFPILLKALSMESDTAVMNQVDIIHNSFSNSNTLLSPTKHGQNVFSSSGGLGSPQGGGSGVFGVNAAADVKLSVRCIRALDLILDTSSVTTNGNNNIHNGHISNKNSIHSHLLASMDSSISGNHGDGNSIPLGELEKWFDKNLTINEQRYPLNAARPGQGAPSGGGFGDDVTHDTSPPSFFSPSKSSQLSDQESISDVPTLVLQGRAPRVGGTSVATRLDEEISMPSAAQQKAMMDFVDTSENIDVHSMPLRVILPLNKLSLQKDRPTVVHHRTSSIFFLLTTQLTFVTAHSLEGEDSSFYNHTDPVNMTNRFGHTIDNNGVEVFSHTSTSATTSDGSTANSMPSGMRKIGSGMSLSGEDTGMVSSEDAVWQESETEDSERNDTISMASPQASPYPYSDDEHNRDMAVVGHTPEWKPDEDERGVSGIDSQNNRVELPQMHLSHCYRTTLYFLAPYSHITVSNCYNCDIIIGACSGAVVLSGCEKVRCSVACRKLIIYNCFDCVFNVACISPSIISGDSRHLSFGPHNVTYTHLNLHLEYTGLTCLLSSTSTTPVNANDTNQGGQKESTRSEGGGDNKTINCWNLMHDMSLCLDPKSVIQGSPSGYALDAAGAAGAHERVGGPGATFLHYVPVPNASVAALLPPNQFAYVAIPHESEYRSVPLNSDGSDSNGSCIPIPEEYQAAWKHRSVSLSSACRLMNESMQSISHIQVPSNNTSASTEGKESTEEGVSLDKKVGQIVANKFLVSAFSFLLLLHSLSRSPSLFLAYL